MLSPSPPILPFWGDRVSLFCHFFQTGFELLGSCDPFQVVRTVGICITPSLQEPRIVVPYGPSNPELLLFSLLFVDLFVFLRQGLSV